MTLDRRAFLRRLGLLSAAAAVIDPAELIEMLAPRRLLVPGASFAPIRMAPRVPLAIVADSRIRDGALIEFFTGKHDDATSRRIGSMQMGGSFVADEAATIRRVRVHHPTFGPQDIAPGNLFTADTVAIVPGQIVNVVAHGPRGGGARIT